MIRLTAGNDTPFIWVVKLQGQPFDLSGKDVKVYVINSRGEIPVASLNIEGNRVSGVFEGRYQTRLGMHSLALRVNEGRPEMKTATVANAFELVQWSADAGGSEAGDVIFAPVVITSELRIGTGGGGGGEGGGSYDDTAVWAALNKKVDKVAGKGLSTNDYTDEEREKLAGLENYDDRGIKKDIEDLSKKVEDLEQGGQGGSTPDLSGYLTKEEFNKASEDFATTAALEGKQDTIEDLDSIRSGAGKGATAVQPSTLEDYATTQQLTELSEEVSNKQDTISDLETIRAGASKGATALQSVPDAYATKQYVEDAIKEIPQGGGEPSQYIKDATTSEDGNTLTLTKKDNTKVVFSPIGGGTGGGVSKEHYYDITILDQIYRVNDACANSRYVVVGALKGISLYDRLTNTQIVSETTNLAAVKLTSEGVYVLRGNLLEVRDFNLNIIHTVDLGHSNFDKFTFTDTECYAVIEGALTRINATSEPQIVAGYESNVAFVKHAYNVGTSIVMLDSSDNKHYLSILEYPAYKSLVPNQSLVYVGATNSYLVKTAINTLGIVSNQLILGRLFNEAFSDIKIALTPLTQLLIIKSCSVIEGVIFSVATTKNFISNKVAIMNNTIYNISDPDLTSHTLCAVLGQVGNGLVTRIKVIDL